MAKLVLKKPTTSSRQEISLGDRPLSIGRDSSNDLVLTDVMVSRRHAVIEWRGGWYYVRDCSSLNGSLVNGDRVTESSLRDGDLVAIGAARLLFREGSRTRDSSASAVPHPSAPGPECPTCHADSRARDVFCRECGTRLAFHGGPAKIVCTWTIASNHVRGQNCRSGDVSSDGDAIWPLRTSAACIWCGMYALLNCSWTLLAL